MDVGAGCAMAPIGSWVPCLARWELVVLILSLSSSNPALFGSTQQDSGSSTVAGDLKQNGRSNGHHHLTVAHMSPPLLHFPGVF